MLLTVDGAMSEDPLHVFARLLMHALQIENTKIWNDTMAQPRYADHDRLVKYGHRVFSQTDEDGIIAEIFRRIGTTSKLFVEIGVGDGTQCNTVALLCDGWSGTWIEGYEPHFNKIEHTLCPKFPQLNAVGCMVDASNINTLITAGEIDFLSIDIDGNDFWVWKALDISNPRVVCVEYNPLFKPPTSLVVPYDAKHKWDGTNYYGATLKAFEMLGRKKGYSLVGCSFAGSNAFFVRNDLMGEKGNHDVVMSRFSGPFTAEEHYEPIRFYSALGIGHAANPGFYQHVSTESS